jgi:hypothetical protein
MMSAGDLTQLSLPRQASSPAHVEEDRASTMARPGPGTERMSRAHRGPPGRSYTAAILATPPAPQAPPATVLQTATSVARASSQDQWDYQASGPPSGPLSSSSRQLRKVMSTQQRANSPLAPQGLAGVGGTRPPSTAGPLGWGESGDLAGGGASSSPHSSHASGLPAVAAMLQALRVSTGNSKTFLGTMLGAQLSASGSTKAGSPSSYAVPSTGRTCGSIDGPFEGGVHREGGQQGVGLQVQEPWAHTWDTCRPPAPAPAPALSTLSGEGRGGGVTGGIEDAAAYLSRVSAASTSTTSQWHAASGHPTVAALSFSDTLQGAGKGRMRVLLVSPDPGKVQVREEGGRRREPRKILRRRVNPRPSRGAVSFSYWLAALTASYTIVCL